MRRKSATSLLTTSLLTLSLLFSVTACSPAAIGAGERFEIAGGDTSGVYYNYAERLAEAANRELGTEFVVAETQGSVENLKRVGTGQSLAGFAQGDTAVDAVRGEGNFEATLPVQAAARVYDEYVHVVVPTDSEVTSLTELAGHAVSLGAENSGVQVIALRVLAAAGVDVSNVNNLALGLEESIAAMQRGEIEAFFWVGGLPTPGIERLEESMSIRLLSIESDVVDRVNSGHAGVYQIADFPVGIYGLDGATVTMTVPNYLIASADAPDELVYELLRVLFQSQAQIALSIPAASYLDRRQAIFTGPLELHPGAEAFYRDVRH